MDENENMKIRREAENKDVLPEINVTISKDRMEATIEVGAHSDGLLTADYVTDKLKSKGISFGIKENVVNSIVTGGTRSAVIAEGLKPQNGVDAQLKYYFTIAEKGRPAKIDNDRVDYKNLNLFTAVQKDQILVERIPATEGASGKNILGQEIKPRPGKSVMLPAGKNTQIVEDNKLVAMIDGQVVMNGNKVVVTPTIEIKGNVDLSTGNINFGGGVIVRGNVMEGFSIIANGDVEIYGTVSGGIVEGRNVIVKAGIQGMQRGYIKAEQDIHSGFVENAVLTAGGSIFVYDVVLHSNLKAGQKVVVQGKKGSIIGGHIVAGGEISAKYVGNVMQMATKLEVGVNPQLRLETITCRRELGEVSLKLEQAQNVLARLKAMGIANLSEDKRELMAKLTKNQFQLAAQEDELKNRLAEIEIEMLNLRDGRIRVSDCIYPGCKLVIGSFTRFIESKEQCVTFKTEEGEIRSTSY